MLQAADEIATRRGLAALSIRNIARRAGLSPGLIIFHFGSKEQLVLALLDRVLATTTALHVGPDLTAIEAPLQRLLMLLRQEMERLAREPRHIRLFFDFWNAGIWDRNIRERMQRELDRYREAFRPMAAEVLATEPESATTTPLPPSPGHATCGRRPPSVPGPGAGSAPRDPIRRRCVRMFPIPLAAALALLAPAIGANADSVPLYHDLGSHHYAITTSTPAAQAYFDQGLRLYYAFNHAEAIRAFREAQRLDSTCAMCFWGEALAWGPNINAPMDSAGGVAAYAAMQHALAVQDHVSDVEHALIEALAVRYAPPARTAANRGALDSAYATAMDMVARRFPSDPEAAVLASEAAMDLRPWNYWTRDGALQPGMAGALTRLERVIAVYPSHPGACHFYIHAVEAAHPDRAVPCAERLAALMPGAGHLVHMPGHIYVRVGRYLDAITANEHAVHADETYIRDQRPGVGTYTAGYYPHNYDFLAFAAAMAGRRAQAIQAADRLASVVPRDLLGAPGMTFLQHHITRRLQLRVRFGRWDEILCAPAPPDTLPHARAMWHYARGRAFAARGNVRAASAELARVRRAATDPRLAGVKLEFNEAPAILRIAEHVLAGSIAAARGDHARAVARLRHAAELEDALTYGEPPDWTVPVRHDLGAVLLTAGRPADAERVYREDLQRFPRNGWSLVGLSHALRAQGKRVDAERAMAELRRAWATADVTPTSSRY